MEDTELQNIIDATSSVDGGNGIDLERGELGLSANSKSINIKSDETGSDEIQNRKEIGLAAVANTSALRPTAFAKVEKSLASLGFFTPSSRRIKNQKMKRVSFTREIDGKRMEVSAEIHPSGAFGLPVTADQDKYLALQKIITNTLQSEGKVTNPIRFKSSELLRLLNTSTKTGKNYKAISEWLDVMSATTIISDGAVYVAGQKRFARDRFRVFDRALSFGKELDDGTVADANYIWLSAWQLENINNKFLIPIDLETYRELKNHIAKALVPLLQVWLYASKKAESFEKRYAELCEILTLQTYRAPSQILRQFKPSLDELTHHGYIEKWRIEKTSDRKSYKIILFHGPKFHRDRRRRLEQKDLIEPGIVVGEFEGTEPRLPELGTMDDTPTVKNGLEGLPVADQDEVVDVRGKLVDELSTRGLMPSTALKLFGSLPADRLHAVRDYIDYFDMARKEGEVGPGFLYDLIKNGDPLPASFETHRQKADRVAAEIRGKNLVRVQQAVKADYESYAHQVVDQLIEALPPGEFEGRVATYLAEPANQSDFWKERPEVAEQFAGHAVRAEISKQAKVLPYEDFYRGELPRIASALQLDLVELGNELIQKVPNESEGLPSELNARRIAVSFKDEGFPISIQSSSLQAESGLTEATSVHYPSTAEHEPTEQSPASFATEDESHRLLVAEPINEDAPEDKGEEMKSSPLKAA